MDAFLQSDSDSSVDEDFLDVIRVSSAVKRKVEIEEKEEDDDDDDDDDEAWLQELSADVQEVLAHAEEVPGVAIEITPSSSSSEVTSDPNEPKVTSDHAKDDADVAPFLSICQSVVKSSISEQFRAKLSVCQTAWEELCAEESIPLPSATILNNLRSPALSDENLSRIASEHCTDDAKKERILRLFQLLRAIPDAREIDEAMNRSALRTVQWLRDSGRPRPRKTLREARLRFPSDALLADHQRRRQFPTSSSSPSSSSAAPLSLSAIDPSDRVLTWSVFDMATQSLQQQVLCLSSHSLRQLMHCIRCPRSAFIARCRRANADERISLAEAEIETEAAGAERDSREQNGFFFINNVFYFDELSPQAEQFVDQRRSRVFTDSTRDASAQRIQLPTAPSARVSTAKRPRKSPAHSAALAALLLQQMDSSRSTPLPASPTTTFSTPDRRSSSCSTIASQEKFTNALGMMLWDTNTSYPKRDMSSLTLSSLSIPLKTPQLFVHCDGLCEHVLLLQEVREFHPLLDQDWGCEATAERERLPTEMWRRPSKQRCCQVCQALSAEFVTMHDRLADSSPAFFCKRCYHCLHYDTQDRLLYDDFLVFPYDEDFPY